MTEEAFRSLLENHLKPMFAGIQVEKVAQPSRLDHALCSYQGPTGIRIKPSREAGYRLLLTRRQPISSEEKDLLDTFAEEVAGMHDLHEIHRTELMAALPRRVMARHLAWPSAIATIQELARQLESLAAQTYEGQPIVVAVGVTGSVGHGPVGLHELWKEDFSRVLSNGFDSIYKVGSDGRVFDLELLDISSPPGSAPHRLGAVAKWTTKARKRIALTLNRSGELLVFADGELKFSRRRGEWRYYSHDASIKQLGQGGSRKLRAEIYRSALDVSFARTGGCIALLSTSGARDIAKYVKASDMLPDGEMTRVKLLKKIANRQFQHLDRRLRQELLAMDGATVVLADGTVLTAGAIVKVPGGSSGGGRRAAATALSKLGLALKISADGPITAFRSGEVVLEA